MPPFINWSLPQGNHLDFRACLLLALSALLGFLWVRGRSRLVREVSALRESNARERKKAEAASRNSEAHFRQVVENISQVFWLANPNGTKIHYINSAYEKIWGRSCESLVSNPNSWMESIHPKDQGRIAHEEKRQFVTGRHDHIYRIIRADGSVRWIRDRAFPVRDESGALIRIAGIAEDITERKQTEERLQEYEKVVEGLEEMIVVVDKNYRYLIANRAFLKYRGMERDALVGLRIDQALNPGVFEDVVKEKLDRCLQGEAIQYELKYRYSDRGERDLLISYSPIEGPRGIDRVACVLQDITERKQAEEKLRALSRRLFEVREEEAKRIAREIHDEMGQALTALKLDAKSIEKQLRQNERVSNYETVYARLNAMSLRIDSSVEMTRRICAELRPGVFDQLGLVAALEWQTREFESRTGIFCNLSLPEEIPELNDQHAITIFRIFQEVLTNIARHAEASEVHVQLEQTGNRVILTVKDNGRGISEEEAQRAQGLGLLGMRERAVAASGDLRIQGKPGSGTTVTLRLPV
jgi:PAS domain S-box-containing protein